MEEGTGIRRLHQRRGVEGTVPRRAEAIIRRHPLPGQIGRLIRQILDARVEVGVPHVLPPQVGRGSSIDVADIAFAK